MLKTTKVAELPASLICTHEGTYVVIIEFAAGGIVGYVLTRACRALVCPRGVHRQPYLQGFRLCVDISCRSRPKLLAHTLSASHDRALKR